MQAQTIDLWTLHEIAMARAVPKLAPAFTARTERVSVRWVLGGSLMGPEYVMSIGGLMRRANRHSEREINISK